MPVFVEPLQKAADAGKLSCACGVARALRHALRKPAPEIAQRCVSKIVQRRRLAAMLREEVEEIEDVLRISAQRVAGEVFFVLQVRDPGMVTVREIRGGG